MWLHIGFFSIHLFSNGIRLQVRYLRYLTSDLISINSSSSNRGRVICPSTAFHLIFFYSTMTINNIISSSSFDVVNYNKHTFPLYRGMIWFITCSSAAWLVIDTKVVLAVTIWNHFQYSLSSSFPFKFSRDLIRELYLCRHFNVATVALGA